VTGESEDIKAVASRFRSILASNLDPLSYVTRSEFIIDHCTKVLEWEPHKKERRMLAIEKFDPTQPPMPELTEPLVKSAAQIFAQMGSQRILVRPLQCFRYGLVAQQPEEQFQYFWQAFETLADATREAKKIPISCQKCGKDLICRECGEAHERRPMAADQMRALLVELKANGSEVYKTLSKVRNHLTHGGAPDEVLEASGITLAQATDEMGAAAWFAIYKYLPKIENGHFAVVESVVSNSMLFTAEIQFAVKGDQEQPGEDQIPLPQLSLITSFGSAPVTQPSH